MLASSRAECGREEWYGVGMGMGMAGHNSKALGVSPGVSQSLEIRRVGMGQEPGKRQIWSFWEGHLEWTEWVEGGYSASQSQEALTPGWIRSLNQSG